MGLGYVRVGKAKRNVVSQNGGGEGKTPFRANRNDAA